MMYYDPSGHEACGGGGGNPEQNEQPITPAGQVGDKGGTGTKIYSQIEYKGTVKVNGEVRDVSRRVYQRNDIDINYFDETTEMTNLERMQAGRPPIGSDGNLIQLHHVLQKEVGPMVEIQETTH